MRLLQSIVLTSACRFARFLLQSCHFVLEVIPVRLTSLMLGPLGTSVSVLALKRNCVLTAKKGCRTTGEGLP
jgi:hypothetical protein